MPPEAVALTLVAALLHAVWNAVVKRSGDPFVLVLGMNLVGGIVTLPWLILNLPAVSLEAIACVIPSGVFEVMYAVALAAAYQRYELSVVYPVARGSAPVWLALLAVLFLGERPSPGALLGIGAIVAGIYLVTLKSGRDPFRALREHSVGLAAFVGVCIAAYSAVDKVGVRYLPPVAYVSLVFLWTSALLVPVLWRGRGLTGIVGGLRAAWRPVALVGTFSAATYGLVLFAFSLAPVSYAGALREVSVVFATLIGWLRLREPFGLRRTAAAALVALGALLVARG